MSLALAPLLPVWLLALLGVVALGAAFIAYRRASLPAALRFVTLLIFAVLLANPVRRDGAERREPPRLVLVADASASMARNDADGERLAAARKGLDVVADGVGARFRSERQSLNTVLSAGSAVSAEGGTDFMALGRLAEGTVPAAIVLASDGGDRGRGLADQTLASAGVPVYCLAVGSTAPADNASVRLDPASPTAFPGQELALTAVVEYSGAMRGRSSELILRADDGSELAREKVELVGDVWRHEFTVAVGDKAGPRSWRAELAPLAGEVTTDDNHAACSAQIVDRALRIAVIEGQPYWDTSFAVRSWRRDRQLQVAAVYRLGGRTYRSGGESSPLSAESLAAVDIIVLGAHADEVLDAQLQRTVVELVDQGKGLLLIGLAVPTQGPLAALDPLLRRDGRRRSQTATLAEAGRRLALLPILDRPLAEVTAAPVDGLRPRTELLLGDEQQPLAAMRRFGGGRVASVNAEGLWQWSLGQSDGEIAARFWRQLVKALVADAQEAVASDRPRYLVGQEASITAPDGADTLAITAPDGSSRTVPVSAGAARVLVDRPGLWTARSGDATCLIVVESDVRELVDTVRRDDRLLRLAGATGGEVLPIERAGELAARLARRADLQLASETVTPLVPGWWWPPLLILALAGEWWQRRRRYGVV